MGTALDYALEVASSDDNVRATLDWMREVGFVIRTERGGRDESFGNVLLDFERPPTAIRLIRDRGQWTLGIAPDGGPIRRPTGPPQRKRRTGNTCTRLRPGCLPTGRAARRAVLGSHRSRSRGLARRGRQVRRDRTRSDRRASGRTRLAGSPKRKCSACLTRRAERSHSVAGSNR